ncbi:MAG TPA: M48 family metalloprotease [Candidatus Binataceae bacterium]|nr:M48 family metalloprotease [Candidatus Binataceae bacterium]
MPLAGKNKTAHADSINRSGWRLRLPDQPPVLEDSRLLEYRHPSERWLLVLALALIAMLVIGGLLRRDKDILFAGVAIYLSMLVTSIQAKTYYRLQGAEVTPTQFPAIYKIVEELRQRFRAPVTRVFVLRKVRFQADAFGLAPPYAIVLPHVLIDSLDLDELRYVLGQALGHICFGHTRIAVLMGGEEASLPAILSWVAWVRDLIFAGYWRAELLSGDRAGILACEGVAKAIRAQLKISVGTDQVAGIRGEDLIEQAFKVSHGLTRLQAILIRWRSPTPPLIPRLEAMVEWAGLPPSTQL